MTPQLCNEILAVTDKWGQKRLVCLAEGVSARAFGDVVRVPWLKSCWMEALVFFVVYNILATR